MKKPILIALAVSVVAVAGFSWSRTSAQPQSQDGVMKPIPPGQRQGDWSAEESAEQTRTPIQSGPERRPSRVLRDRPGRLVDLLVPTDELLEVLSTDSPEFAPGAASDPIEELQGHTSRASAVIVVRALELRSQLTDAGRWISSVLVAQIEEILKAPSGPEASMMELAVGQIVNLPVSGGEVLVSGNQRIRARQTWAELPEKGKRYLYFVGVGPNQLFPAATQATFEVTDTTLRRLQRNAKGGIDKDGMDPGDAFNAIRAAANVPRQP